jgi:V/A-type H+-transporting ATPase subunit E
VTNHTIYERIRQKGEADAKNIVEDGIRKAELASLKQIEEAKKEIALLQDKLDKKYAEIIKTKTTQVEQLAKQTSLAKRKALIDQIFQLAHQKLLQLSDEELFQIVVTVLKKDELNGDEEIRVSKKQAEQYKRVFQTSSSGNEMDLLNEALKGKKWQLTLSTTPAVIDGGFLVVGKTFDIDHSYRALLAEMKNQEEIALAKMLFGGE